MAHSVSPVMVKKVTDLVETTAPDLLAVEEPLEIRLGYGVEHHRKEKSLSVTMRTPGHDLELAMGFLFSEGIIHSTGDILSIRHCHEVKTDEEIGNVVRVELGYHLSVVLEKLERHFYTTSSCGVCGKSSIEAVKISTCTSLPSDNPIIDRSLIHDLPDKLREAQAVFEHTGGLHAAGLFRCDGTLLLMREDVGRHNALDKLIGAAAQEGLLPLHQYIVQVSGRASFELVQKAMLAGLPFLCAVGAPSSLAVKLAAEAGMTLIGFTRNRRYNIYTASERVKLLQNEAASG